MDNSDVQSVQVYMVTLHIVERNEKKHKENQELNYIAFIMLLMKKNLLK